MSQRVIRENGFEYVEEGQGKPIVVLHGLFGALSNFDGVMNEFSPDHRVLIPLMPIYAKTEVDTTVDGLTVFIEKFLEFKGLDRVTLLGNSLGGHVALVFTLRNPEKVRALVLTGSSGLFEAGMGTGFPRRGSYEYVKERVAYTFYDPEVATQELVDEVYEIVNDNFKTLRVLKIARSAQRHNMRKDVVNIQAPTLLIWGLNDNITPPRVAHEFADLLPNNELHFIDHCGHAAMMERPDVFNSIMRPFLDKRELAETTK